jgi:uncharacterized protein (UPF0248 family)
MHPLKNVFNYILWGDEPSKNFEITYKHRGAEGDKIITRGDKIKRVGRSWFSIFIENTETVIPFHRINIIRNSRSGETLWVKRKENNN